MLRLSMEFPWNAFSMSSRTYVLPDNRGIVLFEDAVLLHMYRHAQTHLWNREAGGQLFSPAPHVSEVVISVATGPHRNDKQTRCQFVPDLSDSTLDREKQFAMGNHAVGLWHTHPEDNPEPSGLDCTTTRKYLDAFNGEMEGFLLVILGRSGNPFNMSVWIAFNKPAGSWIKLPEICDHKAP